MTLLGIDQSLQLLQAVKSSNVDLGGGSCEISWMRGRHSFAFIAIGKVNEIGRLWIA
jgi:exopolyphosphatase/pppGpp-phosphohydrolase